MIFKRLIFIIIFISISCFISIQFFYPIYISNDIIIKYFIHPFNICIEQPEIWYFIKLLFIFTYLFSNLVVSNYLFSLLFKNIFHKNSIHESNIHRNKSNKNNIQKNSFLNSNSQDLNLVIGLNEKDDYISIPEKGLYQNILITGTIGTGKTSGAMYPFTKQLIKYKNTIQNEKLGMLILDVKGNFISEVKKYVNNFYRTDDLIVIDLNNNVKYNPLHKPNLKPSVLANRLKTILLLFSPNNSESFWLDKVEQILTECIKLCRLYNNNYVTFEELHNLIVYPSYYEEKLIILKNLFTNNKFSKEDTYNLLSAINFFEKEYKMLDDRTISILKSEITRITNLFISDYQIKSTFCPKKAELNFYGFKDVIENGKIVVLNMNIAEYKNLSKVIAAYLKLDFQTEVLNRLSSNNDLNFMRSVCFISDEYHEYVTTSDSDFFAQSREAKCINIISTQSYTSLLNTLNNTSAVKVIIQNLVNKLWLRSDDIFTIEDIQKQIGKEDKEKFSKTISENAKKTNFNYILNNFKSTDSNISESYNSYFQTDYIYDTNFFTQNLQTFYCLSFLSDGTKVLKPQKIKLIPFF